MNLASRQQFVQKADHLSTFANNETRGCNIYHFPRTKQGLDSALDLLGCCTQHENLNDSRIGRTDARYSDVAPEIVCDVADHTTTVTIQEASGDVDWDATLVWTRVLRHKASAIDGQHLAIYNHRGGATARGDSPRRGAASRELARLQQFFVWNATLSCPFQSVTSPSDAWQWAVLSHLPFILPNINGRHGDAINGYTEDDVLLRCSPVANR